MLCSNIDQSCTNGDGTVGVVPACLLPPPPTTTCKLAQTKDPITGACISPVCLPPQVNDAITAACITPTTTSTTCKLAQTKDPITGVCISPVCTPPQINDAITAACITPPTTTSTTCKLAQTKDPITGACVSPVCTPPQVNDAITAACITPSVSCTAPSVLDPITNTCGSPIGNTSGYPSCSTLLCADVPQSCIDSNGNLSSKGACPIGSPPPTATSPPTCSSLICADIPQSCLDANNMLSTKPACPLGGTSTGGTGTSGTSTAGGGGACDISNLSCTAAGTCAAYFHPDGFGGCSNGDCPAGYNRLTIAYPCVANVPPATTPTPTPDVTGGTGTGGTGTGTSGTGTGSTGTGTSGTGTGGTGTGTSGTGTGGTGTGTGSGDLSTPTAFNGRSPGFAGFADGRAALGQCEGHDCSVSPSCSTGSCSPSERMDEIKAKLQVTVSSVSGNCPPINIDLSAQHYGNHSVREHCNLMEQVRTPVTVIMTIIFIISSVFIVLGA